MELTNKQKREIVRKDYNAISKEYAESYSQIDYCKKYVDDFIKTLKGKNILDVGCGAGQFTNYFCELGFNAKGIDFSTSLIKIAQNKYPNVNFICADIVNYNTDELYDGIFIKDMLFHLPDQDIIKTLRTIKRILKPNGKICIIMDLPKEAGEHIFVEELNNKYNIYYNYLTPAKLQSLLKQAQITIDSLDIVEENDNASSYASGLMIVQANNSKQLSNQKDHI